MVTPGDLAFNAFDLSPLFAVELMPRTKNMGVFFCITAGRSFEIESSQLVFWASLIVFQAGVLKVKVVPVQLR